MRWEKLAAFAATIALAGACSEDPVVAPSGRATPDAATALATPPGRLSTVLDVIAPSAIARDVNSAGVVVGQENVNAFRYPPIGPLPNLTGTDYYNWAGAVNGSGEIVGYGWPQSFANCNGCGFHMDAAGNVTWLKTLDSLTSQAYRSLVTDISDAGEIIGTSADGVEPYFQPVVWTSRSAPPTRLGTLAPSGSDVQPRGMAPSLNGANRLIAGVEFIGGSSPTPVLWTGASIAPLPGLSGNTMGEANDVADNGMVIGVLYGGGSGSVPVVWRNGLVEEDLTDECLALTGTPGGLGKSIAVQSNGDVVGVGTCAMSFPGGGVGQVGVIFRKVGSAPWIAEYPALGAFSQAIPQKVSAGGYITGEACTATGQCSAVRWRLTTTPPNTPPSVTIGGPYTGTEGATIAMSAIGTDAENDPLTYSWDFGDGTTGTGASPSHAYADNGSYTVTVTVSDGQASTSATTTATISNVVPTGSIVAPAGATVPQGTFALTLGNIVEPGSIDAASLQFRHNCGSGFGGVTSSPTASCTRLTPGATTLRVAVRDKDGGTTTATKAVTVVNVPPTVTLLSPAAVTLPVGGTLTVSASFTDPGTADNPWNARVRWQAGQPPQNLGAVTPGVPFGASRVYPTAGVFTATIEVTDRYGGFHRVNVQVTVQ